ncbi:hypothetical protein HKX48_000927 [Thoreauomyces humboldtii]|nr:hypothetical protein HKX48_000927 [Thoreauomyces humboldtii]
MSGQQPQGGSSSGKVFIPPRRNVPPARLARGGTTQQPQQQYTPPPYEINRSATVPSPGPGPHIAPRVSSGATVSIPSRGASALAFPGAPPIPPGGRNSFLPPPRRTVPVSSPYSHQQQGYPLQFPNPQPNQRQSVQVPRPTTTYGYPNGTYQSLDPYQQQQYSQQQQQFPSNPYQHAAIPQAYTPFTTSTDMPYVPSTQAFPEPQFFQNNQDAPDLPRRPLSFADSPESQARPHRHSISEASSHSDPFDDTIDNPRLARQGSDPSVRSGAPFIPPRSSAFMIPCRNASVQRPNIDTLLDEGATAYAAPRHDVEEALGKWRQARELAVKEKDLLREAKALSNMGCALRSLGHLQESLSDLRESWDLSTRYVEEAAWKSNSLWLQLVMRHADIDSDVEPEDGVGPGLNMGVGGNHSTTSSLSSLSTAARGIDVALDASQGPPIVVWFLQLTTNLGNAHYCLGQYQEAIQYHDMCKRLAEAVLEEYPLPAQFTLGNLQRTTSSASLPKVASIASLRADSSGSVAGSTTDAETGSTQSAAFSDAGPSTKTKIKLSYLHRQTLLAESRSLTHLGLCHQQLGLDDEALATHKQAESIVTFYSARLLLASTSTRKASLSSNPQDISTEVSAAEAATLANLGTSYYAKGRIPLALDCHDRAAKLYANIGDRIGRAKEEANLGCLSVEVGKVVNALQWANEIKGPLASSDGAAADNLDECRKYWGPPRLETVNWATGAPDEHAPEILGQPLFDQGILALYEVEKLFRESHDWIGRDFVMANLAVGYVLLHQPYLALYYLSRLVHEPTHDVSVVPPAHLFTPGADGIRPHDPARSDSLDAEGKEPPVGAIAAFLYPHVYFTLTQALFVLTRLQQENPSRPLFPPASAGTLDHGTGIPVMALEPVRRLFRAMDLPVHLEPTSLNDSVLTELLEGCRAALDAILKIRVHTVETLLYSGSTGVGSAAAVAAVPAAGMTLDASKGGLDMVKQKGAVTAITGGKVAWLVASAENSGSERVTDAFRRLYYEEAGGAFAKSAKDVLGFHMDRAPSIAPVNGHHQQHGVAARDSYAEPLPVQIPHASVKLDPLAGEGVVGIVLKALHRLGLDAAGGIESAPIPPTSTASSGNAVYPVLLAPLCALTADLTAHAQSTHARHLAAGLDLPALLGVPRTSVSATSSTLHHPPRTRLLAAATTIYASSIGVCAECAKTFASDLAPPEGQDVRDVVFVPPGVRKSQGPAVGSTAAAAGGSSVGLFPCAHFSWSDLPPV